MITRHEDTRKAIRTSRKYYRFIYRLHDMPNNYRFIHQKGVTYIRSGILKIGHVTGKKIVADY